MIRIAYVINTIETPDAGTEQQLLMLLRNIDRARFDIRLYCLRESLWLKETDPGVPVHVLSVRGLGHPSIVREQRKLIKSLRDFQCDIVHALYFDSVILSLCAMPFAGRPCLVTSRRGFLNSENPQRLKSVILRRISPRFQACFCNSYALAEFVKKREQFPDGRLHVVRNGYDLARFGGLRRDTATSHLATLGISDQDLVIAATANLRPVKNISFLVRAASRLLQTYPYLRFVIMGEGPERGAIEQLVAELRIGHRFHLLGNVSNPESILANAHIAVLTSRSESLSNSLIEYSATGLPVVASDVGGNSEVIESGTTGFLYPPDDMDAFVAHLSRLIQDSALRLRLGQQGRETARIRFSRAACIDRYETIYKSLIANRRETHS